MLIDERQSQIVNLINERKYVSVEDLVKTIYASPATIRRDLYNLELLGLIKRVRGGASSIENVSGEIATLIRQQHNVVEKRKIAAKASQYIENNKIYFFDSSTTVTHLIPYFKKSKNCIIITNGLDTATLFNVVPNVKTIFVGGELQTSTGAAIGADANETIVKFNADVCFFSCHGLSINGPTEGTVEQQKCKENMVKNSKFKILLVDSSKFDKPLMVKTCNLRMIDIIITNKELPKDFQEEYEKNGIKLIVA